MFRGESRVDDKAIELARYDSRAQRASASGARDALTATGADAVPLVHRVPYLVYERFIRDVVRPGMQVLELGAGTGAHTLALLRAGAQVTASDISEISLAVLVDRFAREADGRLATRKADIEHLPFADASFDVVVSAGALSYGEPATVDAEVRRVLRRGGAFLCVDSLNHNPIYRLNRWRHYRRGERTLSTLVRMPTLERIAAITAPFEGSECLFFGAASWLMGPLARVIGETRAAAWSDTIDRMIGVRRSAFKFVLYARARG